MRLKTYLFMFLSKNIRGFLTWRGSNSEFLIHTLHLGESSWSSLTFELRLIFKCRVLLKDDNFVLICQGLVGRPLSWYDAWWYVAFKEWLFVLNCLCQDCLLIIHCCLWRIKICLDLSRFGRKASIMIGCLLFTVGAVVMALALSKEVLLVGRLQLKQNIKTSCCYHFDKTTIISWVNYFIISYTKSLGQATGSKKEWHLSLAILKKYI